LAKEPERADSPIGWNATHDIHWFMIGTLAHLLTPSRWQKALGCTSVTETIVADACRAGPIPDMRSGSGRCRPPHGRVRLAKLLSCRRMRESC
jgi:hypothetical protein